MPGKDQQLIQALQRLEAPLKAFESTIQSVLVAVNAAIEDIQSSMAETKPKAKAKKVDVKDKQVKVEKTEQTQPKEDELDSTETEYFEQTEFFKNEISKLPRTNLQKIADDLKIKYTKRVRNSTLISQILSQDWVQLEESLTRLVESQAKQEIVPDTEIVTPEKPKTSEGSRVWDRTLLEQWPKSTLVELCQQIGITHLFRISKRELVDKVLAVDEADIELALTTHWPEVKKVDSAEEDQTVWRADDLSELTSDEIKELANRLKVNTQRRRREHITKDILASEVSKIMDAWSKIWPSNEEKKIVLPEESPEQKSDSKANSESAAKTIDLRSLTRDELVTIARELGLVTGRLKKEQLAEAILNCSMDDITRTFFKLWPEIQDEHDVEIDPPGSYKWKESDFEACRVGVLRKMGTQLALKVSKKPKPQVIEALMGCTGVKIEKAWRAVVGSPCPADAVEAEQEQAENSWKKEDFSKYSRTDITSISTHLGLLVSRKSKAVLVDEILTYDNKEISNAISKANLGH